MHSSSPTKSHRAETLDLAESLDPDEIYHWLVQFGYFPESYVLPPCFTVASHPKKPKRYANFKDNKRFEVEPSECVSVHFPKSELTDRTFGIMNPKIYNDIAYEISKNWKQIADALIPSTSDVVSYSFPIPVDATKPGRLGILRSGRQIYEFIGMIDDDLASTAYRYTYLVRADIKNFYPSIYTHSIAWALHGKEVIRSKGNSQNYRLLGNRLDKLFQYANDRCTNGIPIGPVVSDVIAEIVASAVDSKLTEKVREKRIECEIVRFKDDYRVLVKSESDAHLVIKLLQSALKQFNLEINESKTAIFTMPDGLFREWASKYHAANPKKRRRYKWKDFRELYLAVLSIDRECPGTGVIDRFLADIVSKKGVLKVDLQYKNLQKVLSMLIMLATRRTKAFPKIIAIIESVLRSNLGVLYQQEIIRYLEEYLSELVKDEERYKYLISWISYFFVSNSLSTSLDFGKECRNPIIKSVLAGRSLLFENCDDFSLFIEPKIVAKSMTLLDHLEVFNPPKSI